VASGLSACGWCGSTAKPVGLWWALLRTLLLLARGAALVFDGDMRGLHDKAADTLVIRI